MRLHRVFAARRYPVVVLLVLLSWVHALLAPGIAWCARRGGRLFLYLSILSLGQSTAYAVNEVQHITLTGVNAPQVTVAWHGQTAQFVPGAPATGSGSVFNALSPIYGLGGNISVSGSSNYVTGPALNSQLAGGPYAEYDGNRNTVYQNYYHFLFVGFAGGSAQTVGAVRLWKGSSSVPPTIAAPNDTITLYGCDNPYGGNQVALGTITNLSDNAWAPGTAKMINVASPAPYHYYNVYWSVRGHPNPQDDYEFALADTDFIGVTSGNTPSGWNGTYDVTFNGALANTNVDQMTTTTSGVTITTNPEGGAVPTPVPTPTPSPNPDAPTYTDVGYNHFTVVMPAKPSTASSMNLEWAQTNAQGVETYTVVGPGMAGGGQIIFGPNNLLGGAAPQSGTDYTFRAVGNAGGASYPGGESTITTKIQPPDKPGSPQPGSFRSCHRLTVKGPLVWPARANTLKLYAKTGYNNWYAPNSNALASTVAMVGTFTQSQVQAGAEIEVTTLGGTSLAADADCDFAFVANNSGGDSDLGDPGLLVHTRALPGQPEAPVVQDQDLRATQFQTTAQAAFPQPNPDDSTSFTLQQRALIDEQQKIHLENVDPTAAVVLAYHGGTASFAPVANLATVQAALAALPGLRSNIQVTGSVQAVCPNYAIIDTADAAAQTDNNGAARNIFDHNLNTIWYPSTWSEVHDVLPGNPQPVQQIAIYATQPVLNTLKVEGSMIGDFSDATDLGITTPGAAQSITGGQRALYLYVVALPAPAAYKGYRLTLPMGSYSGPYPPNGSSLGGEDPSQFYKYGIADIQLLGSPRYTGDYTVEFTRSLAGQDVDQLAVDASSVAGVTTSTVQAGQVGDWTIDLAKDVLPGQTKNVQSLLPQMSYQIRWVAVGYDPADITAGPPTTLTTKPPEVDALIANGGTTDFIGQDIHDLDGTDQTQSQWVTAGNAATYKIQVVNNEPSGNPASQQDDFVVTGPGSDAKWMVTYFDANNQNITAQVTGAGFTITALPVGSTYTLSVEVAPNTTAGKSDSKDILVTSTIASDNTQADAVLATTYILTPQPADALIASSTETSFAGNYIYNLDGTDQTKEGIISPQHAAIYYVQVKNDGSDNDDFLVIGPGSGAGWTVRYFDGHNNNTDITDEVLGEGWIIGNLAPGETREIRVEVTPDDSVEEGASFDADISVMAYSDADEDVVKAHTVMGSPQGAGTGTSTVDATIQSKSDYQWMGSGHSDDGYGATRVDRVSAGSTSVYRIRIQNFGATQDTLRITRTEGDATGWTVRYWDAPVGGTEITQSVVSATGWITPPIDPGFDKGKILRVEVTPNEQQTAGSSHAVVVHVTSVNDATQSDAVKAHTIVSDFRPAAQIRNATDTSYIGANVYNLDGTAQTKTQTVGAGTKAVYFITIENLKNAADKFVIKLNADPAGIGAVKCFNALYFAGQQGGDEITSQVLDNTGWTTPQIASGDSVILRLEVTPSVTATDGDTQSVLVTATSIADPTKQDAVKATAIVQQTAHWNASIANVSDTSYVGANVYNGDGTNQTKTQSVAPGVVAVYALRVRNEGNFSDKMKITGPIGDNNWNIRYYDALNGGNDITNDVAGAGWSSVQDIPPGQANVMRVEVTPSANTQVGTSHDVLISATSANIASTSDAVKASTTTATMPTQSPTVDWFFTTDKGPNVSGTRVVIQPIFKRGANPLATATLTIQGGNQQTTLRNWTFAPADSGVYIARATIWDSTHFNDGTPVTITAQCTDSAGNTSGSVTYTVNVFNKAYVLGNNSWGVQETSWIDSASDVSNIAPTMRYNVHSSNSDHKAAVLTNIPDFTVFSIGTHGGINEFGGSTFGDCFAGLDNGEYINYSEVQSRVATKTTQPPYNFVQMFSCMTGGNGKLADAFGVTGNSDRAFLGFDRVCLVNAMNRLWTQRVWQYLQQGMTIKDAEAQSTSINPPMGTNTPTFAANRVQIKAEIYGDPLMKLSGVYGGNLAEWYKEE